MFIVLTILEVVLLVDDLNELLEPDVVGFDTVLDVPGAVEVVLCKLL